MSAAAPPPAANPAQAVPRTRHADARFAFLLTAASLLYFAAAASAVIAPTLAPAFAPAPARLALWLLAAGFLAAIPASGVIVPVFAPHIPHHRRAAKEALAAMAWVAATLAASEFTGFWATGDPSHFAITALTDAIPLGILAWAVSRRGLASRRSLSRPA